MNQIKRIFKRNTHNLFFQALAGFGQSMKRFYENRNHDIYSNGEVNVLKNLSKLNPKVIFDVGANKGIWGQAASECCKHSKIYCFEPVPDTFDKLNSFIKSEGITNITTVRKGFYSSNTSIDINQFISGDEHSSLYEVKGAGYVTSKPIAAELVTGDEFIKSENIDFVDFIKLDIEGAEMDALIGLSDSLDRGIIRMIQFEYGYINITTRKLLIDFYEFLESRNYIVGKIYPKRVTFKTYTFKDEDFIGPNYIAIRKDDTEIKTLLTL